MALFERKLGVACRGKKTLFRSVAEECTDESREIEDCAAAICASEKRR